MAPALKELYDPEYIELLSQNISKHYPNFKTEAFKRSVFNDNWSRYELKERMRQLLGNIYQKSTQKL